MGELGSSLPWGPRRLELREAFDRRVLAGRCNALYERSLVEVGKPTPCIASKWYRWPGKLLEAVRRRQRLRMVTQVVLAELAGVVAEIAQEPSERRRAGPQVSGLPGSCGGIMPVRSGCMPVKKALRPEVQLCSA